MKQFPRVVVLLGVLGVLTFSTGCVRLPDILCVKHIHAGESAELEKRVCKLETRVEELEEMVEELEEEAEEEG